MAREARACFATFVSASLGDEVRRGLDRLGQPLGCDGQLDRDRRAPREGGDRGGEAFVGEDRRVDAARERAELLERAADLGVRLAEELVDRGVSSSDPAAGELEREPDPEQPLLGAVVEVALEPPPLGVSGLDDAGARGAHLGELGAELRLQPRVLEGQARRGADAPGGARLVEERRVVNEGGDALPSCWRTVTACPSRVVTSSGLPRGST